MEQVEIRTGQPNSHTDGGKSTPHPPDRGVRAKPRVRNSEQEDAWEVARAL